jgi:hypothetical protein
VCVRKLDDDQYETWVLEALVSVERRHQRGGRRDRRRQEHHALPFQYCPSLYRHNKQIGKGERRALIFSGFAAARGATLKRVSKGEGSAMAEGGG